MAVEKHQFDDDYTEQPDDDHITIDLNPKLRSRIRRAAHKSGLRFKDYILNILEQTVSDEEDMLEDENTTHEQTAPNDLLEQIYEVRAQVIRDSNGEIFEDSAEVLRQQREERTKYLEQLRG